MITKKTRGATRIYNFDKTLRRIFVKTDKYFMENFHLSPRVHRNTNDIDGEYSVRIYVNKVIEGEEIILKHF